MACSKHDGNGRTRRVAGRDVDHHGGRVHIEPAAAIIARTCGLQVVRRTWRRPGCVYV